MIDWHSTVIQLRKSGYTYQTIASETGLSADVLGKIGNRTTKRLFLDEPAIRLLDLAYDVLPDEQFRRLRSNPPPIDTQGGGF